LTLLEGDQLLLAQAIGLGADLKYDQRPATVNEAALLRRLFSIEVPGTETELFSISRRRHEIRGGFTVISGHLEAVMVALRHLRPLSDEEAAYASRLSESGSMSQHSEIRRNLIGAGHHAIVDEADRKRFTAMGSLDFAADELGESRVLAAIGCISGNTDVTDKERWARRELADLIHVTGLADEPAYVFRELALVQDDHLAVGLLAIARAFQVPLGVAAGQAMLSQTDDMLYLMKPPQQSPELTPIEGASADLINQLVEVIMRSRGWVARMAYVALHALDRYELPLGVDDLAEIPCANRRLATFLLGHRSEDRESFHRALVGRDDPTVRAAVGEMIFAAPADVLDVESDLVCAILADEDLTVRAAAVRTISDPPSELVDRVRQRWDANAVAHWSCPDCGRVNELSDEDCQHCPTGTKLHIAERWLSQQ
jgi:hypothetical protein